MSNQTNQPVPDGPTPATSSMVRLVSTVSLAAGDDLPTAPQQRPISVSPSTISSLNPITNLLQIAAPECGVSDCEASGLSQRQSSSGVASSTVSSPRALYPATRYLKAPYLPPALNTRRQARESFEFQLLAGSEWEAVDIASSRKAGEERALAKREEAQKAKQGRAQAARHSLTNFERGGAIMSRNRPRGPSARDNGAAANEEIEMWNRIRQDIFKAAERNEKQKSPGFALAALREKIAKTGRKATPSELEQMENFHRIINKHSDEERAILLDEPADVIKNLEILIALRSASEADPQTRASATGKPRKRKSEADASAADSPAPAAAGVSDKLNRLKSGTHRSTSVSSSQAREAISVKSEDGVEGTKGTAAEKSGQLFVGAEVVFKHNKKQQGVEGEGIQCIIKSIAGEGHKKRYDVQDPEPNENGEEGAVYKTTAASLIPIPQVGASLPFFSVGKQVLARYPDTTTFYRAEVMGSKKDVYRLKFEGEEDDKEMDVDRRFVLDIPGK
ncbi:hypothetical protein PAAG_00558 [Paracoccidioides lutzii Pb01]|uniref:SGF29 C-terminal domain-containing protein n=1 Tax=Paracoccidioides lutzii (strain ATCC MYA-826 / Pb01) TaxID=502779 RepID=C1GPW3_PARBA|nr:hypothetical protein PAAG_00558 [Paracoccidioides lutzii Pb01]EEH36235.2 hypothetical protein PAAG_00558 [Paracoccidioides lutzii Pb01]